MSQVKLYEALAFLLAFVLLLAGAGIKGYHMGSAAVEAKYLATANADQKARDETAQIIAQRLADMASTQAKTVERVTHEVKTNTVYRDCVVPDSGVRLLNDAISGTSEPAGDNGVQAAITAP
jgi:hypothetical protein